MFNKATVISLCTAAFLASGLYAKDKSSERRAKVKKPKYSEEFLNHKASIDFLVATAADAHDVPAELLQAMCFHESGYRLNLPEVDDGGSPSYGICQVKLGTARHMEKHYNLPVTADVHKLRNPYQNAAYAAMYLRYQFDRYKHWRKAVAAYNMGTFYDSNPNEKYVSYVEGNLQKWDAKFSLGKPNKRHKKDTRPSAKKFLAAQPEISLHRKPVQDFGDL